MDGCFQEPRICMARRGQERELMRRYCCSKCRYWDIEGRGEVRGEGGRRGWTKQSEVLLRWRGGCELDRKGVGEV